MIDFVLSRGTWNGPAIFRKMFHLGMSNRDTLNEGQRKKRPLLT